MYFPHECFNEFGKYFTNGSMLKMPLGSEPCMTGDYKTIDFWAMRPSGNENDNY